LLKAQPLAAAKIDDAIEEHLNGRQPDALSPEFPITSQIDGELRELRVRERRFELGLTQEEVAKAAGTSHSAVSRLEKGTHIPQLPTLQRIAAVLDEELLVCFQRTVDGEVEREFAAVA
jgi:DNA-binding XRE family transcriptional regulator